MMRRHGRNIRRLQAFGEQCRSGRVSSALRECGRPVWLLLALGCAPDQFVSMGYDVENTTMASADSSGGATTDSEATLPGASSVASEAGGAGPGELVSSGGTADAATSGAGGEVGGASAGANSDFRVRMPLH